MCKSYSCLKGMGLVVKVQHVLCMLGAHHGFEPWHRQKLDIYVEKDRGPSPLSTCFELCATSPRGFLGYQKIFKDFSNTFSYILCWIRLRVCKDGLLECLLNSVRPIFHLEMAITSTCAFDSHDNRDLDY